MQQEVLKPTSLPMLNLVGVYCFKTLVTWSCMFLYTLQTHPEHYPGVGDSLMNILKQLITRQMASMFEFEDYQCPWLQIKIIKCLTKLSALDEV